MSENTSQVAGEGDHRQLHRRRGYERKNLKEIFISPTMQLSRMNDAARSLLRVTGSLMIAVIVLAAWGLFLPIIVLIAELTYGVVYIVFGLLAFCVWFYCSRLVWKATDDKKAGKHDSGRILEK